MINHSTPYRGLWTVDSRRVGTSCGHFRSIAITLCLLFASFLTHAQLGSRVIVGYFHNWNNASSPYIRLANVDSRYNVINIAFAVPAAPGDMNMTFAPLQQSKAEFIADIQTLHAQGRRVQISIGGADAPVELNTSADVTKFVTTMKSIITEYGFDGLDIDLEATSVILNSGDNNFKSPTTPKIVNLISATREVTNYFRGQGKDFWLTAAPEAQYVQGGYGFYGTAYGGYLPVLYGVRDLLTFVHVQYYNTGSQTGLDDKNYNQTTPDFIVAMTDMLLKGFPVARNTANMFPALRQDQVAFGLPATGTGAAPAGGYVALADINKALNYLVKGISYGGQYVTNATYPNLRGIMTWSVNWDATTGNTFAANADNFFSGLSGGNIAPSASITAPANNASFIAPASITISATATDSDGSVSKVEFYNGATKLGEDTAAPYTYAWTNVAAGTYPLRVVATDNQGATGSSATISINVTSTQTNTPPTASITAPASGATFTAPASITISANATDNGSIAQVAFYNGGTLLGTDTSSPYSFAWTNVAAGSYSLTAVATDNQSATGTSTAVNITVNGGTGSGCTDPQWTATNTYVGTSRVSFNNKIYEAKWWTQNENPETNSSDWAVWKYIGPCGGGTTNNNPTVSLTAPSAGASFTAPASITLASNAADSDGTITKVAFYNGGTLLNEDTSSPYSYTWSSVGTGSYTLTAIATDNAGATATSAAVTISVTTAGNNAPTVGLTAPASGATFTAPASITLSANAADSDGTIAKVAFYNGGTLLNEDTSSPYSYSWTGVTAGTYSLTARATDNSGVTSTSASASVTVNASTGGDNCNVPQYTSGATYAAGAQVKNNSKKYTCQVAGWCSQGGAYEPGVGWAWDDAWDFIGDCTATNNNPVVTLTAPAAGTNYTIGASVTLSATATDTDGTITQMVFLVDGTAISTDTSSPYSATWTATQGFHTLTARATDNGGNTTTSASITISAGSTNNGGLPARILSGYWHTWNGGVPFVKLRDVSPKWDVINISFAEPIAAGSTTGQMKFVLAGATADYTTTDFKNDIRALQAQGKKIVISVGGYEGYFSLTSTGARDTFVANMKAIIDEYGFDGMDIDLEQSSLELNTGDADFRNPTSPKVVNMIAAIRTICDYKGSNFILSFAPEAFYLQLGYQWYAGTNANVDRRAGVYIPVIHALRDKLTYVQAQLYNQPAVMALDNVLYNSGNSDYLVALSEMLLKGFNVGGNSAYFFPPLRPDQVLFGVPASASAAGSGQVTNQQLQQAFTYMVRGTSYGGQYHTSGTYPTLRGIMTWSINWDAFQNSNSFVNSNRTYLDGLGAAAATASTETARISSEVTTDAQPVSSANAGITLYPNPGNSESNQTLSLNSATELGNVSIQVTSAEGVNVYNKTLTSESKTASVSLPSLPKGLYMVRIQTDGKTVVSRYLVK